MILLRRFGYASGFRPSAHGLAALLPVIRGLVGAALIVSLPLPSHAALTCGDQPEIAPAERAAAVKADAKGKADQIVGKQNNAGLRGFVLAQRQGLRHEYAEVDASQLDAYLMWITCQTISNDPAESASQKFDRYADVYRLLNEPIKGPVHAE